MKIGLALSGGGFRATVFHLGVLARLAEDKRLEDVTALSTVSGGSLCIGLVYALNEFHWPGSAGYLDRILPAARTVLTTRNLQSAMIWRQLSTFWTIFDTRADDLSALLRSHWGVTAWLSHLPKHPRWVINATCYETGKNWRFEHFQMGDYIFGYTHNTDIPLSDALAASAGFPILIGPLVLDPKRHQWFNYKDRVPPVSVLADLAERQGRQPESIQPAFSSIHLWDGGAYDNHGLESLHDFEAGWEKGVEFLIVSDGAGRPQPEAYRRGIRALQRMVTGIMMDQVRSLRSRAILERIRTHQDKGAFLQIGNTCAEVCQEARRLDLLAQTCGDCLSEADARRAAEFPTGIKRLKEGEFELLFRHGFEVANYTLCAYYPLEFQDITYRAPWAATAVAGATAAE